MLFHVSWFLNIHGRQVYVLWELIGTYLNSEASLNHNLKDGVLKNKHLKV